MENKKDIFVIKAHYNSDEEILETAEQFHDKFGDSAEILCIKAEEGESDEAYWAGRRDRVVIEIEKIHDNAVIPVYLKDGQVSMNISSVSVDYDEDTDQYIYHTGLKISKMPDGLYAYLKPCNSTNDCYISDYMGFGESEYEGEIIVMFKNRTSIDVRNMLEEWKYMKSVTSGMELDKNKSTGETISEMKGKSTEFSLPHPYDYKPYEVGENICEVVFVNSPFVKFREVEIN